MGSNRNEPCPCGSGKKYKKCCLNQLTKDEAIISSELSDALDKPCWYHGTDQSFNAWKLPVRAFFRLGTFWNEKLYTGIVIIR
ncbi:MAG: hypothetical protein CML06_04725 [Pseudomonadales bacterium]|nr:hypothetical protein [Pseudomonadales bacterium]